MQIHPDFLSVLAVSGASLLMVAGVRAKSSLDFFIGLFFLGDGILLMLDPAPLYDLTILGLAVLFLGSAVFTIRKRWRASRKQDRPDDR